MKLADSASQSNVSFHPTQEASSLCVCCGNKGHQASDFSAKHANRPECPLIVTWNCNRLEYLDGKHISASSSMPEVLPLLNPLAVMAPYPALCVVTLVMGSRSAPEIDLEKVLYIQTPL